MNKQPKIFVIVVTYKGMQWYDKCFTSLRESTMPVQTIVVDNTPGEDDANYIREHYPEIMVMKPEQNLGFGKGNNMAMKYAREHDADYVFLLNQDTWLIDNEMFAKLVAISEAHPEYGIVSPMHLKADEKTIGMMLEHLNNRTSMAMLTDLYKGELNDIYETNYVNAAAWLLPRITLETIGGFDPIFTHYGEDDNYLSRVIYHKMKVGVCPGINIVHDHQDSENPFSDEKERYNRQKVLLTKLTDIREDISVHAYLRYYFRKCCLSLFINRKDITRWYEDYLFILRKKRQISISRRVNTQIDSTWL